MTARVHIAGLESGGSRTSTGHDPSLVMVNKRLVAEAYDQLASGFAAAADPHVYRHLARPLVEAFEDVDGPVLDIAAGAGAAGRHFPDAVALDLSLGQLRQNPGRRRVQADGEALPFRADAFAATVCQFGINHFPDPVAAVLEMARVAPVVGVTTWVRPEPLYAPKQVILDVLSRHAGRHRTPAGAVLDALSDRVGSVRAVASLMRRSGLTPCVNEVTVLVPWPGIESFLDYRLAMPSTAVLAGDAAALRHDAAAALATIRESDLDWHARLVVGVGHRPTGLPKRHPVTSP